MGKQWMVRAGSGANYLDVFLDQGLVAIGAQVGERDPANFREKQDARDAVGAARPQWSSSKQGAEAGLLWRFVGEASVDDPVITYDPRNRQYHLGRILGDAQRMDAEDTQLRVCRKVTWTHSSPRDELEDASRNHLGSIMTMFRVNDACWRDLVEHAKPRSADSPELPKARFRPGRADDVTEDVDSPSIITLESLLQQAHERIEDRIRKLDHSEMESFVADLLEGMGYRAQVQPKGKDRGHDIFASPDGLGLEDPRIFVEVKHRLQPIGAPDVRSFLGGRRSSDRSLYVSTGGFTQEARYEAVRSNHPVRLLDITDLRRLLLDHYDALKPKVRAQIPLHHVPWPADDGD